MDVPLLDSTLPCTVKKHRPPTTQPPTYFIGALSALLNPQPCTLHLPDLTYPLIFWTPSFIARPLDAHRIGTPPPQSRPANCSGLGHGCVLSRSFPYEVRALPRNHIRTFPHRPPQVHLTHQVAEGLDSPNSAEVRPSFFAESDRLSLQLLLQLESISHLSRILHLCRRLFFFIIHPTSKPNKQPFFTPTTWILILNTKTLHKPAIEELVSCAHQQAVLVSEGKRQKENQERATATAAAAAAAAESGGNPQPPANSASYSQTRQKYAKVITPPQTSSPSLPPS